MKKILTSLIILVFSLSSTYADSLFYLSIRGTWNSNKDNTKAQFATNNELLKNHFRSTSPVLYGLEYVNDICEATFTVSSKGIVENIKIVDGINQEYDRFIIQIIQATSGKWRPGMINGKRESEEITIWINIYNGNKLKKSLSESIQKSKQLIENREYKKAIKYLDIALTYNRFSIKAIELKIIALKELGKTQDACKLLIESSKYYSERINHLIEDNCDK